MATGCPPGPDGAVCVLDAEGHEKLTMKALREWGSTPSRGVWHTTGNLHDPKGRVWDDQWVRDNPQPTTVPDSRPATAYERADAATAMLEQALIDYEEHLKATVPDVDPWLVCDTTGYPILVAMLESVTHARATLATVERTPR